MDFAGGEEFPLDAALSHTRLWAHSIDSKGIIINISTSWASELKYSPPEMLGKPSVDFLTPASRAASVQALDRFHRQGYLDQQPYDFERADGTISQVSMTAIALRFGGKFARSLALIQRRAPIDQDGIRRAVERAVHDIENGRPAREVLDSLKALF